MWGSASAVILLRCPLLYDDAPSHKKATVHFTEQVLSNRACQGKVRPLREFQLSLSEIPTHRNSQLGIRLALVW